MSTATKFDARNNTFLANAKEVLSKRTYYKVSDAYNAGNWAEVQDLILTWAEKADADRLTLLLADGYPTEAEPTPVVVETPIVDEHITGMEVHPDEIKHVTLTRGGLDNPARRSAADVEVASSYTKVGKPLEDKEAPYAHRLNVEDPLATELERYIRTSGDLHPADIAAQKTLWVTINSDAGEFSKAAFFVAGKITEDFKYTMYYLGARQMEGATKATLTKVPDTKATYTFHPISTGDWIIVKTEAAFKAPTAE